MDETIRNFSSWDVALTDAEVRTLAAGVSPLLVRPDALTFYAPVLQHGPLQLRMRSQDGKPTRAQQAKGV